MTRHPLLFGGLPETVEVSGTRYEINWGYRAMMLIETAMYDSRYDDEQIILNALNIFYQKNIPDNRKEAMECLLWFHRCGEDPGEGTGNKSSTRRYYSFEQDAPYIYAAFLFQYGLRLTQVKNYDMHWWEFAAMFHSLAEDCKISKIMYYRTADTAGMSREQKKFINRMRSIYAIRGAGTEQGVDGRTRLAQRNSSMREYVRKRYENAKRKE